LTSSIQFVIYFNFAAFRRLLSKRPDSAPTASRSEAQETLFLHVHFCDRISTFATETYRVISALLLIYLLSGNFIARKLQPFWFQRQFSYKLFWRAASNAAHIYVCDWLW